MSCTQIVKAEDNLKRTHITKQELNLRSRRQSPNPNHKPKGLWYAIDNDWKEWCKSEWDSWLDKCDFEYELDIDMTNVLLLDSVDAIITFDATYRKDLVPNILSMIDWKAVANDYSGIEISPYQWMLRLDHRISWYYGWDVASGCIWDKNAIKGINRINQRIDHGTKKVYTS